MFEKFAVSTLPFGPFAVVFGAAMLSVAHGAVTGNLRKKAKVEYPNAYATAQVAEKNADAKRFNCAQRAHATYIEVLPQFLILLGLAALLYPTQATMFGTIFLVGRTIFMLGYASGEPARRVPGSLIAYIGLLPLLYFACRVLYVLYGNW